MGPERKRKGRDKDKKNTTVRYKKTFRTKTRTHKDTSPPEPPRTSDDPKRDCL